MMLLAEFFQEYYSLGYTHEELEELLKKIKNGHVLNQLEYGFLNRMMQSQDNKEEDSFSGDYNDLTNRPDIPTDLQQLAGYADFIAKMNKEWSDIKSNNEALDSRIRGISLRQGAVEQLVDGQRSQIEEIIKTCTMFQGESLDVVIARIKEDLSILLNEGFKQDIEDKKVLSEKDFTAEYEQLLIGILENVTTLEDNAAGLKEYIHNTIAQSIADYGKPNEDNEYRLDSIGEALMSKVDKVPGYGLSEENFTATHRAMLDYLLKETENGEITDYIENLVTNSIGDIQNELEAMLNQNKDYVNGMIDRFNNQTSTRLDAMDKQIQESEDKVTSGLYFTNDEGPTTIAVGGLPKGYVLKGKSTHDVLLDMLCPFVPPTVHSARLILDGGGSTLVALGDTVHVIAISIDAEKGSYPISKVIFKEKKSLTSSEYKTIGSYDKLQLTHELKNQPICISESIGANHFIVEITDTNNTRVTTNTQRIDVVPPIYYGAAAAGTTLTATYIKENLMNMLLRSGSDCSFTYTTSNQCMSFAIPESHGLVSEIIDQNGYLITNSFEDKVVTINYHVIEHGTNEQKVQQVRYHVWISKAPVNVTSFKISVKF